MKLLRQFLNVVPKQVQPWAWVLAGCMLLIGLIAGYKTAGPGTMLRTMSTYGSAALLFGVVAGIWLLCLGFVYADAQRRGMRAVLWVLVAFLFPHLLGFLLYFVLRQPIAANCTHCGRTISSHQPFCAWCGNSLFSQDSPTGPLTADPLQ
jgi:hypothetical protein